MHSEERLQRQTFIRNNKESFTKKTGLGISKVNWANFDFVEFEEKHSYVLNTDK